MKQFLKEAKEYSRTSLGIIALMVVLVFAVLFLTTTKRNTLGEFNQTLLIGFVVLFPFFLFGGLLWMVSKHPGLTLDVRNFRDEETYLKALRMVVSLREKYRERPESPTTEEDIRRDVEERIQHAIRFAEQHFTSSQYILWVDDVPENNTYERITLEQVGFRFVLASSTNEALSLIGNHRYAAIISDMNRKEGADEGYVLLKRLREQGVHTPYFIYTGTCNPKDKEEAAMRGVSGITDNPDVLIKLLTGTSGYSSSPFE